MSWTPMNRLIFLLCLLLNFFMLGRVVGIWEEAARNEAFRKVAIEMWNVKNDEVVRLTKILTSIDASN